uniref:FAST kinase domains 1 n=1 Tax=Scleropages formosus TaxID=113540 RepID=A0A8C9SJS9_SCLFO
MLRLRALWRHPCRALHVGRANRDQILEQLRVCSAEVQVFDVVGKHKAKLGAGHVAGALGMLWQFQKEKPHILRTLEMIRTHPQFLTLCVLAENKIAVMDDSAVVDMLYNVLRLTVEPHDSLVQQLVTEAWNRLDRLQLSTLSKFAVCLSDQHLHHSPLMGQITDILSQKLESVEDIRVLTNLMVSVSTLASPHLRDRLIERADALLDTMNPSLHRNSRRVVQFLRNIRYCYRPLLEKCNRVFLHGIGDMDAESIGIILGLYQSLQFNSCDFRLAVRERLAELSDTCTDPNSFSKYFAALGPLARLETREGLESSALLLVDELNPQQALAVVETLEETQCRNLQLITKSVQLSWLLHRNLDVFRPAEIARITQALIVLHYQSPEMFTKLRSKLVGHLEVSVIPQEVAMLTRVLSMLPCPRVEETVTSRVKAVLPQCNLNELNSIAQAAARWARGSIPSYHHSTPGTYVQLLQVLSRCGLERVRMAHRLDLLLEELKYVSGEWFEEVLLEETMVTLQRLKGQITFNDLPELCMVLTRSGYLFPSLMDHIASITMENIHKIHYSTTYSILLPFSVLNYDPPNGEFFETCIENFTPYIGLFDPHLLVLLACCLAVADYFPESLIREIFTVDFLTKLDSQLETLPDTLNMRIRLRLMELNRAVCLECPEFQVPWFHERYCLQMQKKGHGVISPFQQQIHKMLGEVLGGMNYAKVAVLTPYFYTVDFECVLDRYMRPVPIAEHSQLQVTEEEKVQWGLGSAWKEQNELPAGAQRIAVDFLDSRSFCRNSGHMKGDAVMRKRHLEILGYHVVQIPHLEWNSMELSNMEAWKEYLRKKIFTEYSKCD